MTDIFPGAQLIQVDNWGYPMGHRRPAPDPARAFSVVHITANLDTAEQEAAYRLTNASAKNSATFFINPDGSPVQLLGDPLYMDPWTNGDVQSPDLSNPRIAQAVADGVNMNERSLVTLENVGREPSDPITPAQEATCARIIAYYHAKVGVPISRETIIGHYQVNSVNRPNCPSVDKSILDRIVAMASGGGDVNLKGTAFEPKNHLTTITTQAGFTEDPTAQSNGQPFNNLKLLPAGQAFKVDWEIKGDTLSGTDVWYGGWLFTDPPMFGYVISANCGPLTPVGGGGGFTQAQLDAAVDAAEVAEAKRAATAVAAAAAAEAAKYG